MNKVVWRSHNLRERLPKPFCGLVFFFYSFIPTMIQRTLSLGTHLYHQVKVSGEEKKQTDHQCTTLDALCSIYL